MTNAEIDTTRSIEFSFNQSEDQDDVVISWDTRPYISAMDVENEYLTIFNPSSEDISIANYQLVDSKRIYALKFPDTALIPAKSTFFIYTCPGGNHQSRFQDPNVLWTNHDGSLRKKEILNNSHCTMQLYDPNEHLIATIVHNKDQPAVIRKHLRGRHRPSPSLEASNGSEIHSFSSYYRRLGLVVTRLFLLAAMSYSFLFHSHFALLLYWLAFSADILSRPVGTSTEQEGAHIDPSLHERIRELSIMGDRINVSVLYLSTILAITSLTNDKVAFLFIIIPVLLEVGSLSLDRHQSSHSPSLTSRHRAEFRKHPLSLLSLLLFDLLREKHPLFVTAVGLGSELFLIILWQTITFQAWDVLNLSRLEEQTALWQLLHWSYILSVVATAFTFCLRQVNNITKIHRNLFLPSAGWEGKDSIDLTGDDEDEDAPLPSKPSTPHFSRSRSSEIDQ